MGPGPQLDEHVEHVGENGGAEENAAGAVEQALRYVTIAVVTLKVDHWECPLSNGTLMETTPSTASEAQSQYRVGAEIPKYDVITVQTNAMVKRGQPFWRNESQSSSHREKNGLSAILCICRTTAASLVSFQTRPYFCWGHL